MEKTYLVVIAAVIILAVAAALLIPTGGGGGPSETTAPPQTTAQPTTSPPQTTQPPQTTSPPQTTKPPETQPPVHVSAEATICDLVQTVEHRGWRYEDSNGTWLEVSYSAVGSESVAGVQAQKIEVTGKGSDVEEETGYLWLDTTTCTIVQFQLPDGTVVTGPMAQQAGAAVLSSALFPVLTTEGIAVNVVSATRSGWQVTWTDLGVKNVAGVNMHVVRYVGTPLPGSEDYGHVSKVTVEVGQVRGDLWMVVYLKVEYPNGGWAELRVTEL